MDSELQADRWEDKTIIELLREGLETMSKTKLMTNIPGARAGVAQTDRGVPYTSRDPEQARQDAIQ